MKARNADVLILSDALIRELAASGDVARDSGTLRSAACGPGWLS